MELSRLDDGAGTAEPVGLSTQLRVIALQIGLNISPPLGGLTFVCSENWSV